MNFFELDISYFQRATQLTLQEILFLGVFHGAIFSLPFSAPLLICFRRFLLDGLKMGTIALFGTVLGQLSFVLFIFLGFRPLIQCWYIFEPFLAFLGMSLALKLATDFFHQKNFGFDEFRSERHSAFGSLPFNLSSLGLTNGNFIFGPEAKIFCFQFLLMFLNPAFPATSTRLILGQDLLDGLWGVGKTAQVSSSLNFGVLYAIGFILGSIILVSSLVFVLNLIFVQLGSSRFAGSAGFGSLAGVQTGRGGLAERSFSVSSILKFANPLVLNKAFVFLIIGCLLQGTIQYSWRLFTQYPIEFIGWKSLPVLSETASPKPSMTKIDQTLLVPELVSDGTASDLLGKKVEINSNSKLFPSLQREFPSFDSNIRHRDKNLPVERHVPVEKVNARRILTGRPPLNEEQKSDAYLKYNSFFLNKIEQSLEDSKIKLRTPNFHIRTYEDISQLQKMKERYLKAQAAISGYSSKLGLKDSTILITKAHPLENTTKGKPKFSYIRELLDKRGLHASQRGKASAGSVSDSLYIHDDIQIYNALFKLIS
jgi:hypothetical protein